MKKILSLIMIISLVFSLIGCGESKDITDKNVLDNSYEEILEKAKGSTVNFYGWGGDQRVNSWLDKYLAEKLKKEYDITLNRVGMNIDEILNKLLGEKQLDVDEGTIDIIWLNGENFHTAKTNELLFGPFTNKLPNFSEYVDPDSTEVKYDFGFEVEGFEAPYGKAQLVMIYDSENIKSAPRNNEELLELAKNNPGKFTYPAPPDFTGSAFVRNIIYDIVGHEQFIDMEADEEVVREAIAPAIKYLKELKPYLWKEGKTYPSDLSLLNNMYSDGEVFMNMTYNPYSVSGMIENGEFKESTNTFVFDNGTIGNTHFLAIPYNSPNKYGAMAVINAILSVEAQASKYDPKNWGDLPVLDNTKLNDKEKEIFSSVKLGKGTIPQSKLLSHRVPEMPADLVPIIEKIWMETIPVEGE